MPSLCPHVALCAALLALLLAMLPSGAAAETPRADPQQEACPVGRVELDVTYYCQLEFSLPSSNGYRISLDGEPGGSGVELRVMGKGGEANYTTEDGSVTATSIKASFGALGRISMRFEPSGRTRQRHLSKQCDPSRPRTISSRLGEFVGSFDFRGEHGYTRAIVHRIHGALGDPLTNVASKKVQCEFRESTAERKREDESVSLNVKGNSPKAFFGVSERIGAFPAAVGVGRSRKYLFLAGSSERSGPVQVIRIAGALGGPGTFSFDPALTTATVSPPAPFDGTGTFTRNPDDSTTWSGNLTVALPGLGRISFTRGDAELATVAEHLEQLDEESGLAHFPGAQISSWDSPRPVIRPYVAPQQKTPRLGAGALLGLLQGGEICISIYVDPWEVGEPS